jgi:iron complex transport system substrate-binding protein
MEAVLAQRPDLVLDYGSIAPTYVSLADRVRAQTGLPVLLLDGTLRNIPQTYRLLGEMLDRRQVAEDLATRAEAILIAAEDSAAALRAKGRPRVLYVRGPRGTEAGLAGSITAEIMEFVGAENVARGDGGSMAQISAEQALAWDPDWLIGIDPAFATFALRDPVWRLLRAVREKRFVIVPTLPYGWVDFPPSVNRLIGLVWLPSLFRQEKAEALVGPLTELYARLFHRRPEPAQIAALLRAAFPTPQG